MKQTAALAERVYRSVTPCRIVDTRHGGGGAITNSQTRTYSATSGLVAQGATLADCGVPDGARTLTANVTITGTTGYGNLRVFPADAGVPNASTINWSGSNQTIANEVSIGLNSSEQFKVYGDIGGGGHTQVIVDVTGFYVEQISVGATTSGAINEASNRIVSVVRNSTADYTVTVDTNVDNCNPVATGEDGNTQTDAEENGNTINVQTFDSAGTLADRYWHLVVLC
ncbi:MAG TPA: hypothetical protein VM093_06370 [Aeromicrobium sp.]|nr:hypothetical protein [Aeromicrobium sp.]